MNKRKRLYERGNNYYDTGIPCGNPKRAKTKEVLCMPSGSPHGAALQVEDMETEGEKMLRKMAQKQLKTDVTLHEVLAQKRMFTDAELYKPLTKEIRGVVGLQQYADIARGDQRIETLRQYGLSDSEIRLQLNKEGVDKGLDSVKTNMKRSSTYGANPEIQQDHFDAIDAKIKEKEASLNMPEKIRGRKEISRQEMDIEKSMFRDTDHESVSLRTMLVESKQQVCGDPNDPINHLPELLTEMEHKAREKVLEKRRKRRQRRRGNRHGCLPVGVDRTGEEGEEHCEDGGVIGCLTYEQMMESKRCEDRVVIGCLTYEQMMESKTSENDMSLVEKTESGSDRMISSEVSSAASSQALCQKNYHDPNLNDSSDSRGSDTKQSFVRRKECNTSGEGGTNSDVASQDRKVIRDHVEFLPVQYIEEHRLNLEQIRELPKFTSYEAGNPSNVLYLKNLSPRVSERDLVSLFGRFQEETGTDVVFRLMTGRMRGQAFVSFADTSTASRALTLVNGFVLHQKPLIIQYGRRQVA